MKYSLPSVRGSSTSLSLLVGIIWELLLAQDLVLQFVGEPFMCHLGMIGFGVTFVVLIAFATATDVIVLVTGLYGQLWNNFAIMSIARGWL